MKWVLSIVRQALAVRYFPTGPVNSSVVDAAILGVRVVRMPLDRHSADCGVHGQSDSAVELDLDSDRNALVAERILREVGTCVYRDPSFDPFKLGSPGFRLIVHPAPDSGGRWERDL